jgi:acetate kinase
VPQVACFDTAFHRSQPPVHQHFALPVELYEQGIRRYGFHGLSYESICAQLGPRHGRVVICHLGNGASLCAVNNGRSVATTMSFSPLDGLTMGTRCGHLDAAAVLYLQREYAMNLDDVTALLYRRSGLLGLSGVSSDMRTLEASDLPRSQLAIAHFVEQLLQGIAAMTAALRGIDTLVFTAGIGENDAALRARVVESLAWMGCTLDAAANRQGGPRISAIDAPVEIIVLRTDEESVIAGQTARTLAPEPGGGSGGASP